MNKMIAFMRQAYQRPGQQTTHLTGAFGVLRCGEVTAFAEAARDKWLPRLGRFLDLFGRIEPGKSDAAEGSIQWAPMSNSPCHSHSRYTPRGTHSNRGDTRNDRFLADAIRAALPVLARQHRGYSFPCDPKGLVDLDQLSDRARINYLYARAVVGREVSIPAVRTSRLH
jgi:hypothetical protein